MQYITLPTSGRNAAPSLRLNAIALTLLMLAALSRPALAQSSLPPAPAEVSPAPAEPAPDRAPETAPALERVEIVGGRASDTEARRQSTASKIVIGREELDRQGDGTLADVLKRLPGVTIGGRPGRGGAIRMRGLGNGYTQILVNGERAPAGLSIETLTPEQVERIEILRAPTAETGAQAIAGTINIVLREDVRKRLNSVQLGMSSEDGRPQLRGSWTRSDKDGDFSYNTSATLYRRDSSDRSSSDTERLRLADGVTVLQQHEEHTSTSRYTGLHLSGRLQWRLGEGDSLALIPFAMLSAGSSHDRSTLQQPIVVSPDATPTSYSLSQEDGSSRYHVMRLNGEWKTRLANGSRFELKAGAGQFGSHSDTDRLESGSAGPSPSQQHGDTRENSASTSGKYTHVLDNEHSIGLGWELEQRQRGDRSSDTRNTTTTSTLGDNLSARVRRSAAWAQDEWNFNPQWSAYAGLRWEGIDTRSDASASALGHNRSGVWTPLLHSAWKLDPQGSRQIRASLTRSYRAPRTGDLINRQTLANGSNSATNPDRAGNPDLRPELATGIDLAYEHYLTEGGLMSVSLFHRSLSDTIRTLTSQGSDGRYLARPENVGDARSSGIELEAKFRAAELLPTQAPLDLRANLSLFRSSMSGVPGPDNRLDSQPRASANLGADYRLRSLPLKLGGGYNWTPAGTVQLSDSERSTSSAKREVDVYALWTFNPNAELRLTAANLRADDQVSQRTVTSSSTQEVVRSVTSTSRVYGLRLEMRL
jgi:iron complex outermembrane receptor protein